MRAKNLLPTCFFALFLAAVISCEKTGPEPTIDAPIAKRLTKTSSTAIGYNPIETFGYDADGRLTFWRFEEATTYFQYRFIRSGQGLITKIIESDNVRADSIVYMVNSNNGQYTGIDIPTKPGDPLQTIVYSCNADGTINTRKLYKD